MDGNVLANGSALLRQPKGEEDIAPMALVETFLSPLQPAVATLLSRSRSLWSGSLISASVATGASFLRRSRAVFARRILFHRSTFADLACCPIALRLPRGASGHGHDAHGVVGLVVDPLVNA
jgi:hypothetical protein